MTEKISKEQESGGDGDGADEQPVLLGNMAATEKQGEAIKT